MHRMKGEESVGEWAVGGYATEGLGRVLEYIQVKVEVEVLVAEELGERGEI